MYFEIEKLKVEPIEKIGVLYYPATSHAFETPLTVLVGGGRVVDGVFLVKLSGKDAFTAQRLPSKTTPQGIPIPTGELLIELNDDCKPCGSLFDNGILSIDGSGPGFFTKVMLDGYVGQEVFINLQSWELEDTLIRDNGTSFDEWRLVSRNDWQTQLLAERKRPLASSEVPLNT